MGDQNRVWVKGAVAGTLLLLLIALGWGLMGTAPLDFKSPMSQITAPAKLSGVVWGEEESVLSGATLTLTLGSKTWKTSSNEDGSFLFEGLPGGEGLLSASILGRRSAGRDVDEVSVDLFQGQQTTGVEVQLFLESTIIGSISPLNNEAEVWLVYEQDGSGARDFELGPFSIDEEGSFEIGGLAAGLLRVRAQVTGFAPRETHSLSLDSGQTLDLGTIELRRGAEIRGQVLDANGDAIEKVRVYLSGPQTRSRMWATQSNQNGEFSLIGVPGEDAEVHLSALGYEATFVEVSFKPGEILSMTPLVLLAKKGLQLSFQTPSGLPLEGVLVEVFSGSEEELVFEQISSASVLKIESIEGGNYLIRSTHPLYGAGKDTLLSAGGSKVVKMGSPNGVVGTVQTRGGDPLVEWKIRPKMLSGKEGEASKTDFSWQVYHHAGGTFRYEPLPVGRYTLEAVALGFPVIETPPFEVVSGKSTQVSVELLGGGQIVGVVLDRDTGDPIVGALIQISMEDPSTSMGVSPTRTDAEGRFVLKGLPEQRRSLEIRAPGYLMKLVSGVVVPSEGEEKVEVQLQALSEGKWGGFELVGIGGSLGMDDGVLSVRGVIEGGPAQRMGLQTGDKILSINTQQVQGMSLQQAIEGIRGEEGVEVMMLVERNGQTSEYRIIRERVIQEVDIH